MDGRDRSGARPAPSPHRFLPPRALHLLAGILVLVGSPGCLREAPPPTDPELAEALGLPPGTPIHRVTLSSRGEGARVLPTAVRVQPGALVQFVAADRRVYAVRFRMDALAPDAHEFIRTTGQEGSPPLGQEGARFVVSLVGAPDGRYPFQVDGYGPTVDGEIVVDSRP